MIVFFDILVGEVWLEDRIFELKRMVEDVGLKFEVIESVNVYEDIKFGFLS